MLRNLVLSQLESAMNTTDYKKYAKRIKEVYPIPDLDKKRIKPSTSNQVASYIAEVFAADGNKPVITSVLLDDIAEGNFNE